MHRDEGPQSPTFAPSLTRRLSSLLGFVLFLNLFLFHPFGSVALALFILGSFSFLLLLNSERVRGGSKIPTLTFALAFLTLSYALVNRTFPLVQMIIVLSSCLLLVSFFYYSLTGEKFWNTLLDAIFYPLLSLVSYTLGFLFILANSFNGKLSELLPLKRETVSLFRFKSLIVGGALGLVVVFVFVGLLSADPIFQSVLNKVNIPQIFSKESFRLIYSATLFALFLPLVYAVAVRFSAEKVEQKVLSYSFGSEVGVVTTLVGGLFALYLLIAWPYLFASVPTELHLSELGVATYSEYVRRGFGEFIIAAGLLYGLLWAGLIALRSSGGVSRLLRITHVIVFIEFILFVFSILRRVMLYQDYHGLSIIRLYGGIFVLLVLLLGFTLFARRLWLNLAGIAWTKIELVLLLLTVIFIAFFNVEQFILLNPPTVNKRVDNVYLSRMSPDGYAGWRLSYQYAQETLSFAESSEFIDKDGRREVAYSGLITSQLLNNYYNLLLKYGSNENRESFMDEITQDFEHQSATKVDVTQNRELSLYFNNTGVEGKPIFTFDHYGFGTFYVFQPKDSVMPVKNTLIANILGLNISERETFEKMKVDMPLSGLLDLQKKYFAAFKKIANQNATEQYYDFDISLSSPLLN